MTIHDTLTAHAHRVQGLANRLRRELSASVDGAAAAGIAAELDDVARRLREELAPARPDDAKEHSP